MRLMALTASGGGVGCTTVAAHTAIILQAMGYTCLALELHPRNQLGAHLGLPQPQQQGWASQVAQGRWWGDAAVVAANGLLCLPYGATTLAEQAQLEQQLFAQPLWLQQQIQGLGLSSQTLLVADVGPPTSLLTMQALRAAETIVCCTTPSLDNAQALTRLHHGLASEIKPELHNWFRVLACRMDARRPSHQRGMSVLNTHWKDYLLADVVHEDEAIAQSWIQGSPVQLHAPHALSSHDLQGVAHSLHLWLTERSAETP